MSTTIVILFKQVYFFSVWRIKNLIEFKKEQIGVFFLCENQSAFKKFNSHAKDSGTLGVERGPHYMSCFQHRLCAVFMALLAGNA